MDTARNLEMDKVDSTTNRELMACLNIIVHRRTLDSSKIRLHQEMEPGTRNLTSVCKDLLPSNWQKGRRSSFFSRSPVGRLRRVLVSLVAVRKYSLEGNIVRGGECPDETSGCPAPRLSLFRIFVG